MIRVLFLLLFLTPICGWTQITRANHSEEKALWKSLKKEAGFKKVFKKYKKYRLEIIYTQIDRAINGSINLKNFHLGDSLSYFYPASAVKLPLAISLMESLKKDPFYNINLGMKLRLDTSLICNHRYDNGLFEYHRLQKGETINDILKKYRISKDDFLVWNKLNENDELILYKSYLIYHRKTRPSIAELIKQMLVYSDNEAYNKLFEIIGGNSINYWLQDKGFENSNVSRKFAYCIGEEKSHTIPFDILNNKDVIIYHGEERNWKNEPIKNVDCKVGKKYLFNEEWINSPRDFSDHNRIPLMDLHEMMQRLLFPQNFQKNQQFDLTMQDSRQLIRDLGMYPNEDKKPRDSIFDNWEDGRNVFLYSQLRKEGFQNCDPTSDIIPNNIRIINIIGQSYGFSTDCMYFTDQETNTEFMLTCRIYTNKNEILGDDIYEYDDIALPLMENLGNYFYEKEKLRKKEVLPNFTILRSLFD